MKQMASVTAAALLLASATTGEAQVATRPALALEGARQVIAGAVAEAKRLGAGGAIAVVDDGGTLLSFERLDGTFAASANIAVGKARTAAMFQRPTKVFEDIINKGRTTMVALPDFTPLQGGVPIVVEGRVVGAVGVSGAASAQQDEDIATAGAKSLRPAAATAPGARPPAAATYLENPQVAAAFARGAPLLEVDGYKVHASRREAPGMAEVHLWETDVIYVLEGSATFVTGGTMLEGKTTAPGEVRGPAIQGGESRRIAKGDVIVIPQGVPHWFKEVQGPVLYFVVKPISMAGGAGK